MIHKSTISESTLLKSLKRSKTTEEQALRCFFTTHLQVVVHVPLIFIKHHFNKQLHLCSKAVVTCFLFNAKTCFPPPHFSHYLMLVSCFLEVLTNYTATYLSLWVTWVTTQPGKAQVHTLLRKVTFLNCVIGWKKKFPFHLFNFLPRVCRKLPFRALGGHQPPDWLGITMALKPSVKFLHIACDLHCTPKQMEESVLHTDKWKLREEATCPGQAHEHCV